MRYAIALALLALAIPAQAQVSCQRIGQQTFCSDGTTANQIGNTTFINPPIYQPPQPVYQAPPVFQPIQPIQPIQPYRNRW